MEAQRSEFLTSMIGILERLHETSIARGEPLLASVLAIAKGEAEDALRHAEELAALHAMREEMSSRTSWRAEDQWRLNAEHAEADHDAYADDTGDGEERPMEAMQAAAVDENIAA